jgi:molybdate-binding protein
MAVGHTRTMDESAGRTGVCIIRVWEREEGIVIRLHMRADVESAATERIQVVADVEAALATIRGFLVSLDPRARNR